MAEKLMRALKIAALIALLLFLLAGLARTVFMPEEINKYENRLASTIDAPSVSGVLEGTFQSSVDDALADQVLFSTLLKRAYNVASSRISKVIISRALELKLPCYISVGDMRIFGGDSITFGFRKLEDETEALDLRIESLNKVLDPSITYLYYIEKDTDINFETNEKLGAYEYLTQRLALDPSRVNRFRIDSFEDFHALFYKTDHHWNADGSYKAYLDLLELLGIEDEPIPRGERFLVAPNLQGYKARGRYTELFYEEMWAYHYDFPEMTYVIDGEPAEDYGNQNHPERMKDVSYSQYYGGDYGSVVISGGKAGGENILIIGESYDNAVIKLLASHCAELHSVDLRHYSIAPTDFHLAEYVEENRIDKVLLIGNLDFFTFDEFYMGE